MFRKSLVWVMVLGMVLVISSGALAKSNFFGIQILDISKTQEAFSKRPEGQSSTGLPVGEWLVARRASSEA